MSPETRIIPNPPKPQQAGISVAPIIKVPSWGPGCVSPSHRGPFALAGGPFRLRARPHGGTSRRVRCAINAPALRRRLGSRYRSLPRNRSRVGGRCGGEGGIGAARSQIPAFMQSIYGQVPAAQVKASNQRTRTKAQCGWI